MLDAKQHARSHNDYGVAEGDPNTYTFGELYGHSIVLASLPGTQGKGAAATVATNLARTFPCIKWRFLVGIGGGVPTENHDIRLGDVVVSMPEGQYGGVVQYDLGKDTEAGFCLKGFLMAPPSSLRGAVETMKSDHMVSDNKIGEFVSAMVSKGPRLASFSKPTNEADILFDAGYSHASNMFSCNQCDLTKCVERPKRSCNGPEIHYGLIASGDSVIKYTARKDMITRELSDVLCFEMEAAGIMTEFTCIVIRGISDYADSHKNNHWHHYAAATAAACAKELLSYLDPELAKSAQPVSVLSNNPEMRASHVFSGTGIQHTGSGNFSVGRNLNICSGSLS